MAIATQNNSASLYSILTYQIKLPPSHPAIKCSRNFQPQVYYFLNNPPVYSNPSSIGPSRVNEINICLFLSIFNCKLHSKSDLERW